MSKSFSGTTIGYGQLLPTVGLADGTLFYKTGPDPDGVTNPPGLYIFNFNQDLSSSIPGDQVGFGWSVASNLADYVAKAGDTMSGQLIVNAGVRAAQGTPGLGDSSNVGFSFGTDGDTGLFASGTGAASSAISLFLNSAEVFKIDGTGNGYLSSNLIWHAGNDGAGSNLDADRLDGQDGSYYLNLANATGVLSLSNTSGILPVSKGGTNIASITPGSIIYAATASQFGSSAIGSASQVLLSGGTGAPSWVAQSALNVGSAATLTTARTISLTGAVSGSVSFNGSSNVSISTTASSIPYSSISGAPVIFYTFTPGTQSPTPPTFPSSSISGFDAYSSTDIGSYQVGMTVIGSAGGGARSLQISASWDSEEVTPSALRFRVNDDTGTTSAWGAWSTIWNSGNFDPGNYVSKSGDSMSGSLYISGGVLSVTGGDISTNSNIVGTGANSAVGAPYAIFTGSVNAVNTNTGTFRVPSGGASVGLDFWVGGQVNVIGNVVAYASDARLKKNVKVIDNALLKVKALGGYEYDWDLEKTNALKFYPDNEHEHGLLAQQVKEIIPDAVAPAPFNSEYLTVKYERLIALLVAAINEQQEQINELKLKLDQK